MADIVIGYTRDIIPEKVVYTGHETPTAVTIVDNTTQEIGVEVKDSVLGDKISAKDNSINIEDLGNHEKEISVNISNTSGNLLSVDSNGLYAYLDTEPFTTRDEYDSLNNSVNSIKRTYATKTWVENKGYITQEKLDEKQDKLTPGENITIEEDSSGKLVISANAKSVEDYNILSNKPSINGKELVGNVKLEDLGINLEDKADISYVNDEVLSLENEISLKQDQLTAGENITISRVGDETIISSKGGGTSNYNTLANKPKINGVELSGNKTTEDLNIDIPTKVSELENDSGYLTEHQKIKTINGESLIGEGDIVIDADSTIGKRIRVTVDVGGISSGTIFEADTKLSTIIEQLLTGNAPVVGVKIYKGLVNSLPTTQEEIESLTLDDSKTKNTLLTEGYEARRINPDNQFVVLAIPKSLNIYVDDISVSGFSIGFNETEIGDYMLYSEDNPVTLTNITYKYRFGEM